VPIAAPVPALPGAKPVAVFQFGKILSPAVRGTRRDGKGAEPCLQGSVSGGEEAVVKNAWLAPCLLFRPV
jgi:hypothetical protein